MIYNALEYLRLFLDQFIDIPSENSLGVILGNIGTANDEGSPIGDRDCLVCTLVNTEEEFTKKNAPFLRKENAVGSVEYLSPPLFLNLYILFSAKINNYSTGLNILSDVFSCFQSKHSFTISNSGYNLSDTGIEFSATEEERFKLDIELYTMTFEQLNHLWGTLGGKQYPSVMYKVRLVQLEREFKKGTGSLINEISLNANP